MVLGFGFEVLGLGCEFFDLGFEVFGFEVFALQSSSSIGACLEGSLTTNN